MALTTPSNMAARFGEEALVQLTNADAWDDDARAKVADAIAAEEVLIQGYMGRRYAGVASLAVVPPLLVAVAGDMAFYRLHDDPPKKVADAYARAIATCKEIRDGKIAVDEGVPDAIPARPGAIIVSDPGRIFSRDKMSGF